MPTSLLIAAALLQQTASAFNALPTRFVSDRPAELKGRPRLVAQSSRADDDVALLLPPPAAAVVSLDEEKRRAFEDCTLPFTEWNHGMHVRVALNMLQSFGAAEGGARMVDGLAR